MENSKKNKEKALSFLAQASKENNLASKHEDVLGFDKPKGYFSQSKNEILDLITKKEVTKPKIFGLKPRIAYSIAASFLVLIGLTFWLQPNTTNISNKTADQNVSSNEILINSLLVSEDNIDEFLENYILDDIIVATELSKQNLENIFINSLFIEDSSIDAYLNETLIENLLL